MKSQRVRRPLALVALGLLGMGGYSVAMQFPHPAIMDQDFVRGSWYGLCLGVEIMGCILLSRQKSGRCAGPGNVVPAKSA